MDINKGPVAVTVKGFEEAEPVTLVFSCWEHASRMLEKWQLDGTVEEFEVRQYREPSSCSGNEPASEVLRSVER